MHPDVVSVHPHFGLIIHRLEVQDRPLSAVLLRDGDHPLVPDDRVERFVADAAGLRLIGERHRDLPVSLEFPRPILPLADSVVIKAEIPFAIEIHPWLAYKLRSRVVLDIFMFCHS